MSMIEKMRDPFRVHSVKKLVYLFIFGFICLLFVFVGLTPDRGGGINAPGTAATVNHTVISAQDFQEEVNRYENQMGASTHGLPAAQRQMQEERIRQSVMQRLVSYELVFQSAEGVGIVPTDSATREYIVNIPAFQEQGRFARDIYHNFLESRNMTAPEFETKIQHELVLREVSDLFFTAWESPQLLDDLEQEARDTKLNIQLVKLDAKTIANSISEKDVDEYLAVPANLQKAQAYFSAHQPEYSTPEQVRARHILFKGDGEDVLKKAQALRKTLTAANFAENAKKLSEDQGSKAKGGDLDYFSRGQMVPEFEKVAFSMSPGQISDPVKSPFGYHLILVVDKKAASNKTFDDEKRSIAREQLASERREKIDGEFAKALHDKKDLEPLLAQYKVKWQDMGPVSITQDRLEGVTAGDQVIEAAMSLKPGEVHGDLVRSGPESYIVRLKGVDDKAPEAKKLDSEMSRYMRQGEAGEVMDLWAGELRKEARIKFNESLLK